MDAFLSLIGLFTCVCAVMGAVIGTIMLVSKIWGLFDIVKGHTAKIRELNGRIFDLEGKEH